MPKLALAGPLALLLFLVITRLALAGQIWQPGFRTVGSWEANPTMRLDLNIWYPSARQAQEMSIGPWKVRGALNGKPAPGLFPLLVISHPTPGGRFSYANLAAWLAQRGFVVAAPCHVTDNMDNMDDLFTWAQLDNRAREIAQTINLVLAQKDISQITDSGRIGLLAFGSGGTAALLLGGALPNCARWPSYCAEQPDAYCTAAAVGKISSMCSGFPLRQSLADPRIKAMAIVAPAFGMLFDAASFRHFYPPLLLAVAGRDMFSLPARHGEYLARLLGKKALYLDLPDADTGALMDACPPPLAAELPELCLSASPGEREQLRATLQNAVFSFFSHYLLEADNLPSIPPPPSLEPAAQKTPPAPQRRRR